MIVVMKSGSPATEIERVSQELCRWDVTPEKSIGRHKVAIGLLGDTAEIDPQQIQNLSPFIERVLRIKKPFKRASLEFRHGEYSEVVVTTPNGAVSFGKNCPLVYVAGPCAVESEEAIATTAQKLKETGVQFLRGGAYKPRTSPYAFQGYGTKALDFLATARQQTGLGIVTEVMDTADLPEIVEVADIVQIGTRNMQNFSLLKKVGETGKPILLKRGMSATIEEWLLAAEYILATGNSNVILCERGIRSFDRQYTRNTLDLSVIPVLRSLTHLPIMVDPSHSTGKAEYVPTMAMAAIAAGADSLMVEVHHNPAKALSDGPQSLSIEGFEELMPSLTFLSNFFGRSSETHLSNISRNDAWKQHSSPSMFCICS